MSEQRLWWCVAAVVAAAGCVRPEDKAAAMDAIRSANAVSDVGRSCAVESYNKQVCCDGVEVVVPDSPRDVVAAVRRAMTTHRPIHAVGRAHTGNPAICAAPRGLEISTEKLNSVIYLERHRDEESVVVDAGVTMIELTEWLHQHHYSLGYHVLEFREATVGGVVGTAAHGSALNASSVVADALESLWLVAPRDLAADKELDAPKEYDAADYRRADGTFADEWMAMTTNLGLLGVVTRLRLRVWPQFNVRLAVSYHCEHDLLADHGATDMLADCDFAQLNWFPRADRVMLTCGTATHDFAPPGMTNSLLNPRATPSYLNTFKWYLRNMAAQRGRFCFSETLRYWQMWWNPPIGSATGNSAKRVCEAIGPSQQMMSSDLTKLEQHMPQIDLEIAVPMSQATAVLRHIDRYVKPHHLCFPLVGIFLRFSKTTQNSLLAHSAMPGEQAVMFVEMVMFKPGDATVDPSDDYFKPYLELARELIANFHGRAHWAKNNAYLFSEQRKDPAFVARVARFRAVAHAFDPERLFANRFTDELGLTAP